jgi:hypothetical protein
MATSTGITDFLQDKPTWNTLVDKIYSGDTSLIKMNNEAFAVRDGETINSNTVINPTNTSVSDAIGNFKDSSLQSLDGAIGSGVTTIKTYMAPTMLALESLDNIGREFDELIKGSFLDQMFHIKGTDILCTAFCILVSFLPCATRASLYKAIQDIKAAANAVADAARAANDLIQTFNATMSSAETIALSAEGLFQGNQNPVQSLFGTQRTGQNAVHAGSTIVASISQVKQTIDMISKLLKVVAGAKITIPTAVNGNIWSLANAVLFALQGMAVAFADKALSTIFNPIEEAIRKMQPQNCIGNLAAAFFNKLIDGIKRFKQWLLLLISELFTSNNNWGLVWKTFGFQMKSMLELIAFLDALKLILVHFGDLAIACGVELCDDKTSPMIDAIRAGQLLDPVMNNVPAIRIIGEVPNFPTDNIDEIANALVPILGVPLNNIYVGPTQIQVSKPLVVNAPKQIRDLLNDPDIARELGPGYKLYTAPDNSNATVVYSFDRKCGIIKE